MVTQRLRAWRDLAVFLLVLGALVASAQHFHALDFGLAIALKGLLVVGSGVLLWNVSFRREAGPHLDGQFSVMPKKLATVGAG